MAEVITRFKLETTQFDSKLRDAAKELRDVAKEAERGGKDFNNFSQKSVEAARSLGNVASGANNAKDKVKDLVGAYNDAAKAYNNLTQAQQQSDFGKALAQSIGQLKDRISEAKQELYGLNDAMGKAGGGLFGGGKMAGMLQVFGGNLMTKAAGWAASLASEMGEIVQQGIEISRQSEGIRMAFERLGRGDMLDGLREATHGTVNDLELMKAAVRFNDFNLPLEELGTMLAFAQQKAKDTGQSVDYLVESIVNGLGRQSTMILDNLGLSQAEVKKRTAETGDMTKAVGQIIREQMAKAGDYVETAADRATKANVELENQVRELGDAMRETFGYEGWDVMAAGIKKELVGALMFTVEWIEEAKQSWISFKSLFGGGSSAPKPSGGGKATPADGTYWETTDANGKILASGRWLNGQKVQTGAGEVVVTPKLGVGGGGGGKRTGGRSTRIDPPAPAGSVAALNKEIADFKKKQDLATDTTTWTNYQKKIDEVTAKIALLKGEIKFDDKGQNGIGKDEIPIPGKVYIKETTEQDIKDQLDQFAPKDPYEIDVDVNFKVLKEIEDLKLKETMKAAQMAASAVSSIGDAFASIEDPSAKAAGMVLQAIASIALGFATASTNANTAGTGWGWLAWLAAGAAAMATTISTIHSLTGFENGGQVSGSSFSGDNIPIMANAGEVVLTRAQQGNLAAQLQGSGSNVHVTGELRGESIYLAVNRSLKRRGKGELVTWK
jgi:hypothetical protein